MKWRCPYCRRTLAGNSLEDMPHWPFCCERCKMADLEGWLRGRYVISRPLAEGDIGEATPADDLPSPGRDQLPSRAVLDDVPASYKVARESACAARSRRRKRS